MLLLLSFAEKAQEALAQFEVGDNKWLTLSLFFSFFFARLSSSVCVCVRVLSFVCASSHCSFTVAVARAQLELTC